jgi:hypothetical protein
MIHGIACWAPLLAALGAGCGPAPAAPTGPAPAAPAGAAPAAAGNEGLAKKAAGVALTALAKRNFDVQGCVAAEARVVPEAEARAGAAPSERCDILVAQRIDEAWLVVVRSTLSSKSYGARALVIISAGAEGVQKIDYAQ